jgi:hypothetical protein
MDDSFGGRLRHERQRRQIGLRSIAESTKIGLALLEGLERNDVSRWPSGVYRKSFVRAYAQAIGLDPDSIATEFAVLYPDPQETIPPAPDAPPGRFTAAAHALTSKPVLLIVNLSGTSFIKGKFLDDIRRRSAAAACDVCVSFLIALCAFMVLGHFWTPLGVSMLCYYAGGIVLLGNTPGVYLFAPERADGAPPKQA